MSFRPLARVFGLLVLAAGAAADEITIASLNCEFLTRPRVHVKFGLPFDLPADARAEWDAAGFRDAKFAEACGPVAKFLADLGADVVALVEVGDQRDCEELRAAVRTAGLDYPHMAVGKSSDTNTMQNVAVFSKFPLADVLPSIPGREHFWREPDDPETEDDTGISKGMRVTFTISEKPVHLYVTHFTSERGGYDADMQRIAQASLLRRHYLPLVQKGEMVLVAGDLNDRRGEPAIRRVRGLDDIEADLIDVGLPQFFEREQQATRWTYEFQGNREQIDYILVSPAVKEACSQKGIRPRFVHHGDPRVSDHAAIAVTLDLR